MIKDETWPRVEGELDCHWATVEYLVEEREIFGEHFYVTKQYSQTEHTIKYILYWNDEEEFSCLLSFSGTKHFHDINYLLEYASSEAAFVDSMFNHMRRTLIIPHKNNLMDQARRERLCNLERDAMVRFLGGKRRGDRPKISLNPDDDKE